MRVFVSVTEKLQCGSPVQAIASPRSVPASSGRPISASRPLDRRHVADVRQDEVLLAGDPHLVPELAERDQLVAGDEPEVHRHADVGAAVALLVHAEVVARRRGRRELEVVERAAEPLLDPFAHAFGPEVVDHELQPRLDAGDAVAEVVPPDVEDRREHGHRVVLRDPDPELAGDPRHRGEPAADQHAEPLLALAERADEADAVDLGRRAAVRARRDRDLVLPREVRVVGVAVEARRRLCRAPASGRRARRGRDRRPGSR